MNIRQFEEVLWNRDGVRVVIRAPTWANIPQPPAQTNAADKGMSITEYVRARVKAHIGDYEVIVIDGNGQEVHGRTRVARVRASYQR